MRKTWRWLTTSVFSIHWTAERGPYKGAVVGFHLTRLWFILVAVGVVVEAFL